jgi:hypothetical protein
MGLTIKCGGKGCSKYFHVECLRRSKFPTKRKVYLEEETSFLGKEFSKWFGGDGGKRSGFSMVDYEWMCLDCGVVGLGKRLKLEEKGRKRGCLKTFKRVRRWIQNYKKKLPPKGESGVIQRQLEHETPMNHQEFIDCEKLLFDSPQKAKFRADDLPMVKLEPAEQEIIPQKNLIEVEVEPLGPRMKLERVAAYSSPKKSKQIQPQ